MKKKYRLPPCPMEDIPGTQAWLEDMAAKGLHLAEDGFSRGLARFEEGPPRQERFRLVATATSSAKIVGEYEPEEQAAALYADLGWTYRARRGSYHIYSALDPDAPELHTDPQVQAMTLQALGKFQKKGLLLIALWLVFRGYIWLRNALLLTVADRGLLSMVLLFLLMNGALVLNLVQLYRLSRLRRQLAQGIPLPHRSDYRRRRYRHLLTPVVLVVLLLGFLLTGSSKQVTLLQTDMPELPFATVQDFYPQAQVTNLHDPLPSKCTAWGDSFTPECWDYRQYTRITQDGQTFDVDLTVTYYRTSREWAARDLLWELKHQGLGNLNERIFYRLYGSDPVEFHPLDLPGADEAVYYQNRTIFPTLLLRKGCVVLKLNLGCWSDQHGWDMEAIAQIALSHLE